VSAGRRPATAHTARRNREALGSLPPGGEAELEEAQRGLVAAFEPPLVEGEGGRVVWDLRPYAFLAATRPRPPTRASGTRAG
jgi:alkyl sulfatase BDS1-like metallo-beta-lactamase superfamily hydrolase